MCNIDFTVNWILKKTFCERAIKLEIMYGKSALYTYLGSLNVDGVCTNKLSVMFVKTSFWAKKIASLCFISSPLKAVEKAFKAKVEAGICGSEQLMCHVEAMDFRYGATSRPTRDMTENRIKIKLKNSSLNHIHLYYVFWITCIVLTINFEKNVYNLILNCDNW